MGELFKFSDKNKESDDTEQHLDMEKFVSIAHVLNNLLETPDNRQRRCFERIYL